MPAPHPGSQAWEVAAMEEIAVLTAAAGTAGARHCAQTAVRVPLVLPGPKKKGMNSISG